MTFSSLENGKGFRETDTETYMGREKPEKIADAIKIGTCPSERLSAQKERAEQLLLAIFPRGHPSSPWHNTLVFKA